MLSQSHLDWVDPVEQVKVFIWRKVFPARGVNLPLKEGDQARQVTPLAGKLFLKLTSVNRWGTNLSLIYVDDKTVSKTYKLFTFFLLAHLEQLGHFLYVQ